MKYGFSFLFFLFTAVSRYDSQLWHYLKFAERDTYIEPHFIVNMSVSSGTVLDLTFMDISVESDLGTCLEEQNKLKYQKSLGDSPSKASMKASLQFDSYFYILFLFVTG